MATARAKGEKKKIVIDLEPSSSSDQEKMKKSTKKVGCTAECPIMCIEKGKWKKCISLCRIMTKHRKGDCRCNDHKGMPDNAKNKKSSKKERKEPKTKEKRKRL